MTRRARAGALLAAAVGWASCASFPGEQAAGGRVVAASPLLNRLALAAAPVAVVAHRGASSTSPENTLAALREAVRVGADVVEFDVHQTRDGAWVLMHDATLDRTSDARAVFGRSEVRVDEVTLTELRRLDAGAWFDQRFAGERVPTLAEALDLLLPRTVPMIERKGGDADALAEELRRLGCVDEVLVQAFDWDWLERLHAAEPRLLLGALGGDDPTSGRLADLARTGARLVHWNHLKLTRAAAAHVRRDGRLLCVYTVDGDVPFLGAAALGCQLVTTNRPAHFVAERAAGAFSRR